MFHLLNAKTVNSDERMVLQFIKTEFALDSLSPIQKGEFLMSFIETSDSILRDSLHLNNNYIVTSNDLNRISHSMGYNNLNDFCAITVSVAKYFTTTTNTTFDNPQPLVCTDKLKAMVYICLTECVVVSIIDPLAGVISGAACVAAAKADFDICCKYAQ